MEQWKQILDYPDYEVSTEGRVRSNKRKKTTILQPYSRHNGYLSVQLCDSQGKHNCSIHRLVLCTFQPCENMEQLQVNHLNCNRTDNRLENLEWSTVQQNNAYREQLKHTPKAETILVKFLDEREDMIFDSVTACANYFGLTRKAIHNFLENQKIRSDRKVQAHFYKLGRTYELNS